MSPPDPAAIPPHAAPSGPTRAGDGLAGIALFVHAQLGSTGTLFRSMPATMVPADRVSEHYGFDALMGRASAALGPLFFGAISMATGSQQTAMA